MRANCGVREYRIPAPRANFDRIVARRRQAVPYWRPPELAAANLLTAFAAKA